MLGAMSGQDGQNDAIYALMARLREFADVRDWRPYHNPKNLVMALMGEVGELAAIFQWRTPEESASLEALGSSAAAVEEEVADVFIYLLHLADMLGIDPIRVANSKVTINEGRFPRPAMCGTNGRSGVLELDDSLDRGLMTEGRSR